MEIINERPPHMSQADYKTYLKGQKRFIKHNRAIPIDRKKLAKITMNGIKKQGKKA